MTGAMQCRTDQKSGRRPQAAAPIDWKLYTLDGPAWTGVPGSG